MSDQPRDPSKPHACLTRRGFLAGAGAAAVALSDPGLLCRHLSEAEAAGPEDDRSTVVEVRSDHVLASRTVHEGVLRDMLRTGLVAVSGQPDEARAWKSLFSASDIIGLKFNQSGASGLGTTTAMARVLVKSLAESGWAPSSLVPIEVPHALHEELGTTPPRSDWLADEVPIGGGTDRLSGILDQVTAIINVPFLKHHNIAGATCCLKNLSHALVKHPARYHGNKCSPYIGDIVALPQIRQKLRIHIVNALRIVTDKGPDAQAPYVIDRGGLLFGVDPVAVDSLGLEILNRTRLDEGLGKIEDEQGEVSYLPAAARWGLGRHELHRIEYVRHRL